MKGVTGSLEPTEDDFAALPADAASSHCVARHVTVPLMTVPPSDHVQLKRAVPDLSRSHRPCLLPARPLVILFALLLCLGIVGTIWSMNRTTTPFQRTFSMYEPKKYTAEQYSPPKYFSVATLSLGSKTQVLQQMALQSFAKRVLPDLLIVQDAPSLDELELIDQVLPDHERIHYRPLPMGPTESSVVEWQNHGNIFFNRRVWNIVEHGTNQFGTRDDDESSPRHLFWVRLQTDVVQEIYNDSIITKQARNETVLVVSVSLSPAGSQREINSAKNIRIRESDAIVDILRHIEITNQQKREAENAAGSQAAPPREAMIIAGDMGDGFSAQTLFDPVGLFDPFSYLHIPIEPTYPAIHGASPNDLTQASPSTRDWIFSNDRVRPVAASVLRAASPNDVISSHFPVLAVYELLPCGLKCSL